MVNGIRRHWPLAVGFFAIGLILGLAVALVVYVSGKPAEPVTPQPPTAAEEPKPPGEPEIS